MRNKLMIAAVASGLALSGCTTDPRILDSNALIKLL